MPYTFKTVPYEHQLKALKKSVNKLGYALLMEMGTGKSKVVIDNAGILFNKNKIESLIIIAPSGVHTNWINEEIPKHLSDEIKPVLYVWKKSTSKKAIAGIKAEDYRRLFNKKDKSLRIVAINIEAIATKHGFAFLQELLVQFNTMLVMDESHRIKNHKAKRTNKALQLAALATYRRILTGTPVLAGAMDLFTQFEFLYPECLGYRNYYAYQARYAILKKMERFVPDKSGALDENGRPKGKRFSFKKVVAYRHVDELKNKIDCHAYRVRKDECLDLPEKVYTKVMVQLTPPQREAYDTFKEELVVAVEQGELSAPNALVKLLRLQQIIGGFMPLDNDAGVITFDNNPKLEALLDIIEQVDGKVIIWARFRAELDAIAKALREVYGRESVVEYHGGINPDTRQRAVCYFNGQEPIMENGMRTGFRAIPENKQAQHFVGQPRSGGIGLTLNAASSVIYFSNDFSLDTRLQSEDRCHRIGQTKTVTYFGIEAERTMDKQIIRALKSKKSFSDIVLNDPVGDWL